MFSPARFPLSLLPIMALMLPGLLSANEKQPPTPASAEVVEMEFEVKKRELACQMAELGVEEAKISVDRVRRQQDANVAADEDRARAALHVQMRQLAAEVARVELEQAKARLTRLRKPAKSVPVLDHPVQVEILEDTDVVVTRGSKEDVEKVVARIQELEGKQKADLSVDEKQTAAIESLLKQRRDTLRQAVELAKVEYSVGHATHAEFVRATDALMEAELDLATDKTQRIAFHEKRVESMKELEELTKAKLEAGRVNQPELLIATAARLKAEIDLLRERGTDR